MSWMVVHFVRENTVDVVPNSWIVESNSQENKTIECFWPYKYPKKKAFHAVLSRESPGCEWKVYSIRILGKYDDFNIAQLKCNKAKEKDVLSTEDEQADYQMGRGCRPKIRNKVYRPDFDSEESDNDRNNNTDELQYPTYPEARRYATSEQNSSQTCQRQDSSQLSEKDVNQRKNETFQEKINEKETIEPSTLRNNSSLVVLAPSTTETYSNAVSMEFKEFQRQIMRQFFIQNNRLRDIQETLQELVLSSKSFKSTESEKTGPDEMWIDEMEIFPLNTEEELQKLEDQLEQNPSEKTKLAKALSLIGGETIKISTKKVMLRMFTNELGAKFSWEGQKGKRRFKNLMVVEVVLEAVRIHFTNATESDITKVMKEWLVRAKFRK